ncbi:MAG: sugar phosphate nucleotidyltransferase [Planctomycetota bacterium]
MKEGLVRVSAVVLAAGKGTRMLSGYPKVLHEICGKSLLYYTLKLLKSLPARQPVRTDVHPGGVTRSGGDDAIRKSVKLNGIYVVVGYESDKVKNTFRNEDVRWVTQEKLLGTGNALIVTQSLLKDIDGIILVVCGDTPLLTAETLMKLIQVHMDSPKSAATILTCQLDNPTGYGRILKDKRGRVKGIIEEREANETQKRIKEINTGTYIFNSSVFKTLEKTNPHSKNGEYYLTDAIEILAKEGGNIKTYLEENASECLGINTYDELTVVGKLMRQRIINELIQKGVIIVSPENIYIEEGVTIGKGTVIYPFSVIRSNVKIGERCQIGPFSHLRSGTVLEDGAAVGNFTEIKKTRLGMNSKAKHLSYLGDAIIGNDVNIGAGTITANFDGVRKEQTIIEDGASTGSGTILIAPLKMGKNTRTGAGAVVPKGENIPEGVTVVGVPAKPLKSKKKI